MTSKSLEALEELKDEIIPDYALEYEDDEGYKDWVIELYQTIKQDLERLGKIENLRTTPNALETSLANYMNKCIKLEKENQELKRYKEKAILYDKACNKDKSANKIIVDLDYLENLQNEERKFGFAIEILTRVANIKTEKHLTRLYEHKYISKEEYELLKEVLG